VGQFKRGINNSDDISKARIGKTVTGFFVWEIINGIWSLLTKELIGLRFYSISN